MAYPPGALPTNRLDTTPNPTNHPADHNNADGAINDIVAELGSGPKGSAADLTARLSTLDSTVAGKADRLTPTAVKTAPYTAAVGDFVLVDATSGDVNITLPTAPVDKSVIGVKTVALTGSFLGKVFTGGSDVISVAGGAVGRFLALNQQVILQYQSSTGIWHILADDVGGTYIDSADFRPDVTGTNDAAAKINAMIAAAVNRQCVLRKGTYKILSPILLPSYTNLIIEPGTVIQADPAAVTTDPAPGTSAIPAIIQNQNSSDTNIRLIAYGVVADGFKANGNRTAGNHSRGLWFNNVTNLEVVGIKVQNVEDHGMQLTDCLDFSIRDCTVSAAGKDAASSAGGSGIGVSVGTTDLSRGYIGNCYLINNLRCGIKIGTNSLASANDLYAPVDVVGCKAKGNGIDGASAGFLAGGPVGASNLFYLRGVNYTNCQAFSNNMAGFQLTIGVKNTTMTGCESWNNGTHGFALFQGIQGCSFIGCHALNNSQTTTTTYDGFNIDASSVVCSDNMFVGCSARDDQTTPTQRWGWFETTSVANARNRVSNSHTTGNVTGHVSMAGHPNSPVGGAPVVALFDDFADVGTTSAAGEDTLFSHVLPISLLNNNGDAVEWSVQGIFANNARGKRLRVRFGGATGSIVGDTGAMTFTGAATDAWLFVLRIERVSSTVCRCSVIFSVAGATLVTPSPIYTELTGMTLTSATQIVRCTGQIAASGVANDIVAKHGKMNFVRAA